MSSQNQSQLTNEKFPRRVPAILTYLHPFRLVTNDEHHNWCVSIEEVNRRTWDYVKLHRVVGGVDVGLPTPYHLLVGFDGALALPPIPDLRPVSRAVEFFNRCLGAILIGGIYCEAVSLDSVGAGAILDWKYIRASGTSTSFAGQFHNAVRLKMANPLEAIHLLNPRAVLFSELQQAAKTGFDLLLRVPELTPEFLLKGVTGLARRDWGAALSNVWVVIEQLTAHLWTTHVLQPATAEGFGVPGRKDQLTDNRSWPAATKQELLYQKGVLTIDTLRALSIARKSRNELFHQGEHPDADAAQAALEAVKGLLVAATGASDLPIFRLNLSDHTLSDPFQPIRREEPLVVEYWMPIPKLPGEEDIEREEAEQLSRCTTTRTPPVSSSK